MRTGLKALTVVVALAPAPVAGAAEPLQGWYTHSAAGSRQPRLDLIVKPRRGSLETLAGVRCARANASVPGNAFRIRGGRFRVAVPLIPRGLDPDAPDRIVMRGRWTSRRTVKGRVRVVSGTCDSGWRRWRAGLVGAFGVRTSVPSSFEAPGAVTTTVTVFNDGDYDARRTGLTVLRPRGERSSAPPDPVIATTQGSCEWPTVAAWADWTDSDHRAAILCDLGTVAAGSRVEVTITESWTAEDCAEDRDGSLDSSWDPALRSPLLPDRGWQLSGAGFGSTGDCLADEGP